MARGKEIRNKISSIRNTQKITKAMEMVSASKMRKAQERMRLGKPYATHNPRNDRAYRHIFFGVPPRLFREPGSAPGRLYHRFDRRGLCGGLNINAFKATVASMREWHERNIGIDVCTIGARAATFFNKFGGNVVASVRHLGDQPEVADVIGAVKITLDKFDNGEIDKLFIISNEFVNTMLHRPVVAQLLPLLPAEDEYLSHHWDYIYEPDAQELLDGLLLRYIESQVYQAVVENIACEQAARMIAMKSASDNAGDLMDELELAYNKERQAAITQELSEIAAGAAAV